MRTPRRRRRHTVSRRYKHFLVWPGRCDAASMRQCRRKPRVTDRATTTNPRTASSSRSCHAPREDGAPRPRIAARMGKTMSRTRIHRLLASRAPEACAASRRPQPSDNHRRRAPCFRDEPSNGDAIRLREAKAEPTGIRRAGTACTLGFLGYGNHRPRSNGETQKPEIGVGKPADGKVAGRITQTGFCRRRGCHSICGGPRYSTFPSRPASRSQRSGSDAPDGGENKPSAEDD